MTTTTEQIIYQYTANGTLTQFAFPAKFLDNDLIDVYVDGVLQSSGYTITGENNQSGGLCTFSVAPTNGETITLVYNENLTQSLDLEFEDSFPSTSMERALDKIVAMIRLLSSRVDLCERLPIYSLDSAVVRGYQEVTDADTTPSISEGNLFVTANTGATSITQFDDGTRLQEFKLYFGDGNTTLVHGSNLRLNGATNVTPSATNIISFVMVTDSIAVETSRNF